MVPGSERHIVISRVLSDPAVTDAAKKWHVQRSHSISCQYCVVIISLKNPVLLQPSSNCKPQDVVLNLGTYAYLIWNGLAKSSSNATERVEKKFVSIYPPSFH
ncbi:uncharacterized protein LOC142796261 [Rhipicephalus microplus]|uniref:uncharacterized protein LOC142796261 n=1 Tax=Rhipicephalus microplus TaxID=6941 RepID=UPI003F6AB3CC